MEELKNIFSVNLNSLMNRNGENIRMLSDNLNVPFSTVSDWKHGKKMPRSGALQKIADHYNVNISYLTNDNSGNDIDISDMYSKLSAENKKIVHNLVKKVLAKQNAIKTSVSASFVDDNLADELKEIFEDIDANIRHLTSNDKVVIKSLANTYLLNKTNIRLDFE